RWWVRFDVSRRAATTTAPDTPLLVHPAYPHEIAPRTTDYQIQAVLDHRPQPGPDTRPQRRPHRRRSAPDPPVARAERAGGGDVPRRDRGHDRRHRDAQHRFPSGRILAVQLGLLFVSADAG